MENQPLDITHDVEQLAIYMNKRDVKEYGTADWDNLDPAGREAYLKDARAYAFALLALGWSPGGRRKK